MIIQRILGILLMVFSTTIIPPIIIALWLNENELTAFIYAFLLLLGSGILLWLPAAKQKNDLKLHDVFIVVVLFWLGLGLAGATPFLLSEQLDFDITNAVFESISGLTTTGATVLTGLDDLPKSILFYRQSLQWLGGMGLIVLAVAVLPMLSVGGMQLYRAEIPGPIKDSKLTPRITETAKVLWFIYLFLTVACCLAYWFAGMSFFDAITHSFSTVSIGGFSTHDNSLSYFQSPLIENVAVIFMVICGINFSLHFVALNKMSLKFYYLDSECRTYISFLLFICVLVSIYMISIQYYHGIDTTIQKSIFQAVSIATTTGFTTEGFHHWPELILVLLLFCSFVGCCAGSTGGGIKVIRMLLLYNQGSRELKRLVHPHAVFSIKINNRPIPSHVIDAVWGFFATFVFIFVILFMGIMATGIDQITAFSALSACINNMGPGLGEVSVNYTNINDIAKWLLIFAMLLGRLEIFTLLILLTPVFWRR